MNKTLLYLVPSVVNNIDADGRKLRNILIEEDENVMILGFYCGIEEFDDDDNLYIIFRFFTNEAYFRVISHSSVIGYENIGTLYDNRVAVKFKLKPGMKRKFKNGEYSKLYDSDMVDQLILNQHINLRTAEVFLKSPKLKAEIENNIGSSLPSTAELDSGIKITDEVYQV